MVCGLVLLFYFLVCLSSGMMDAAANARLPDVPPSQAFLGSSMGFLKYLHMGVMCVNTRDDLVLHITWCWTPMYDWVRHRLACVPGMTDVAENARLPDVLAWQTFLGSGMGFLKYLHMGVMCVRR
jgi:hypothetical protein